MSLEVENEELKQQLAEARFALEIYADADTWEDDDWGIKSVNIVEYGDPGKIARDVLPDKENKNEAN